MDLRVSQGAREFKKNCLEGIVACETSTARNDLVEAAGVEPASETAGNKERLHAQSRSRDFAPDPQNGQGESGASPMISPPTHGPRVGSQPAV
jgi:hypothetical protein